MASGSAHRRALHRIRPVPGRAIACAVALAVAGLAGRPAFPQNIAVDEPAAEEEAPGPSASAQFTTAVENREPIDQVTFVANDARKIFFFSELRELTGRTVTHRWTYSGEVVSRVPFEVGGPRWRVWSSKDLNPDWIGDWTVEVVLDDGEVIAAETFTYSAPES